MSNPLPFTRRAFLAASAAGVAAVALPARVGAAASRPPVVVELFTSQGCNYCPPADAFLGELARRDDLIAVSLNVDYWDYIGWRDTLASPAFTRRQRDYARFRGDTRVYTPQMIVNGGRHFSGADRKSILAEIDAQQHKAVSAPNIKLADDGREVSVHVGKAALPAGAGSATIWLTMVQPAATVKILRGENRGREITYHNVVRRMIPIGMWSGQAVAVTLPTAQVFTDGASVCAAFVQIGSVGPIIAATSIGGAAGNG